MIINAARPKFKVCVHVLESKTFLKMKNTSLLHNLCSSAGKGWFEPMVLVHDQTGNPPMKAPYLPNSKCFHQSLRSIRINDQSGARISTGLPFVIVTCTRFITIILFVLKSYKSEVIFDSFQINLMENSFHLLSKNLNDWKIKVLVKTMLSKLI